MFYVKWLEIKRKNKKKVHCPGLAAAEKRNVRINYNSWTFLKVLIFRSLCDLLFMEIIELFFFLCVFQDKLQDKRAQSQMCRSVVVECLYILLVHLPWRCY